MSKIVLRSVLKITPKISKDLHKDLRTEYAKYAKVFPLAKALDFKLPSKWYRRIVGGAEILSGLILMSVPSRLLKNGANIILFALKLLNGYSHWAINDEFERTAPTLVFMLMLGCRLVVDWQVYRRSGSEESSEATEERDELKSKTQPVSANDSAGEAEAKKIQ
eukprot:maker-scaffold589_size129586-snap-gene-0.51 protein:Tk07348 transcript:maker-scaffold589_size129586-snap-gene-0.51-mRNA-1 annotation:"transmembrane protein 35"